VMRATGASSQGSGRRVERAVIATWFVTLR
jgi:hypothetical protein